MWALLYGGMAWLGGASALACPDCVPGKVARAQVWDQQLVSNLLAALLPFLVVGVVCAWVDLRSKPVRVSKRKSP